MLKIPVENPFNLYLMLMSHGWVDLEPYQWDRDKSALHAVIRTRKDRAYAVAIRSTRDLKPGQILEVLKTAGPRPSARDLEILERKIRWIFRLDHDFSIFQQRCGKSPHLKWVKRYGLGPFLRNSDLFEEFSKVLFTTNVSWAGTRLMNRLVLEHLGQPVGRNLRAFPTAEQVAGKSEAFLRKKIRLGYRAPYYLELAKTFARGRLDLEELLDPSTPTDRLVKVFSSLKGFGPYSVNALLNTLNRFENLILDSWIRKKVAERHFNGKKISDRSIRKVFQPWGEWAALACWFECAYDTWFKADLDGQGKPVVVD